MAVSFPMDENSEGPTTLHEFYGVLAETHEAPIESTSRIHTKAADIAKASRREMKNEFKENLREYDPLLIAEQQPGTVLTFGAETTRQVDPRPKDDIQKALEEAGLDFATKAKKPDKTNFEDDSESSESGIDFEQFETNKSHIGRETSDIIRLRLLLKQNESKLRRWAKIKSKTFRRIHNKERRAEKMQRIEDKLSIGIEAAEDAGLQDLARDLIEEEQDFLNGVYEGGVVAEQEAADQQDQVKEEKNGIERLKFIQNAVNRQEENALLGKAHKKFTGKAMEDPEQNDQVANVLLYNEDAEHPYIIPQGLEQACISLAHRIEEVQEDDDQQKIMASMFPDGDEIVELKESEINVAEKDIVAGWGEWTGAGASALDIAKLERKRQSAEMQRRQEEELQWDARTDLEKNTVFEAMNLNEEVYDKYSARGLGVTDEEYEEYLRQSLLPEYETIANRAFETENSIKVVRGQKVLQEREMEKNIEELERLNRQLDRQKKLIKGERLPGGQRKNHFE